MFWDENDLANVEENDSNDTPACDDDAHKAVLCTHSNFLGSIPMILLHVMTMLTSLFCVLPETFLREIGHTWNIAIDIFWPKFSFLKKKMVNSDTYSCCM